MTDTSAIHPTSSQFHNDQVRLYQAGDEHAINASFNQVFGLTRPLRAWQQKFGASHDEDKLIAVATRHTPGEPTHPIVAQFAALPVRMQCEGTPLLAAQGVDAFSVPAIRTTRLYPRTVEHFFSHFVDGGKVDYVYGFAGTRNTQMLVRHHGFSTHLLAPLLQRESWPLRYAFPRLPNGLKVLEGFNAALHQQLWLRCQPRYRFSAVRDAAWFTQRFPNHAQDYTYLVCTSSQGPHAAVIARLIGDQLTIVDWLWDGRSGASIDALERRLHAQFGTVRHHETWLGGDPLLEQHLQKRGWHPTPLRHPNHLITRWQAGSRWSAHPAVRHPYLTMADADLA